MAWTLKLVPSNTKIRFMRMKNVSFTLSAVTGIVSLILVFTVGLNFGIDFRGGMLLQVQTPAGAEIAEMRDAVDGLGLGEITLQEFGSEDEVLIRVQRQEGGADAQQAAVNLVRNTLSDTFGEGIEYRRVEFVGPQVSEDLVRDGALALGLALAAMLVYIWFRFEWQFGLAAIIAIVHDVVMTIGLFSLTGLEFNLAIIAAILTIVGYSINDTVVVFDRVRENLRKYKKMNLRDLLDLSINDTLSRTALTGVTTLLALIALAAVGGPVLFGFVIAMIWGVLIGTYSSIFVAGPLLLHLGLRREVFEKSDETAEKEKPA